MPLIEKDTYSPSWAYKSGHYNTIAGGLWRGAPKVNYRRTMIRTVDDDVVVIDRLAKGHPRLAVLCHGLEGSSDSSYMRSMSHQLYKAGYDVVVLNFRSCGGVMNRKLRMYHSGETGDLHMVLKYYQNAYRYIVLVGFSLGGNVVLKYLGEDPKKVHHKVRAAVAVSVPVDLKASSEKIGHRSNYIYQEMFLRSLTKKVREKHRMFPDQVDIKQLAKIRTLMDFDDVFTAPIHGFRGADHYYKEAHSGQFLFDIDIPTLLINAQNDPFLTPTCFPTQLAKHSNALFFHAPKHGGHVGFVNKKGKDYHESMALDFLSTHTPKYVPIQGSNMMPPEWS